MYRPSRRSTASRTRSGTDVRAQQAGAAIFRTQKAGTLGRSERDLHPRIPPCTSGWLLDILFLNLIVSIHTRYSHTSHYRRSRPSSRQLNKISWEDSRAAFHYSFPPAKALATAHVRGRQHSLPCIRVSGFLEDRDDLPRPERQIPILRRREVVQRNRAPHRVRWQRLC